MITATELELRAGSRTLLAEATLRVQPAKGSHSLECVIEDETGTMSIVFVGRRQVGGIDVGTRLRAHGTAADHKGRLAIFNPVYTLLAPDEPL